MGYLHVQPNTLAAVQMVAGACLGRHVMCRLMAVGKRAAKQRSCQVSTAIYGALKTLKLGDLARLAREASMRLLHKTPTCARKVGDFI